MHLKCVEITLNYLLLPFAIFDLGVVLGLAPLLRLSDISLTGEPANRSVLMLIDGLLSSRCDVAGLELVSSLIVLSNTSDFSRSVPLIEVEVTDFVISVFGAGDELLTEAVVVTSIEDPVGLVEVDAL